MSIKARITVGDWSDDGHGQTDVIDIMIPEGLKAKSAGWDQKAAINGTSNKTWGCSNEPDLWFYYELAMKTEGLPDLAKDICEEYEDSRMSNADLKLINEKLGLNIQGDVDDDEEDEEDQMVYVDTDMFAELWIGYVNHGIKLNGETGEVKSFKEAKVKTLNYNIGGYGLLGG